MGNFFTGLFYAVLLIAADGGAPKPLTANEHPWGSFLPKSWCIVQTVTTSNIEGRTVRSSQTIKTVLEAIGENGVTLQETESFVIRGETVEKRPLTTQYDFFQEPFHANVLISQGEPTKLLIDKKVALCERRIYKQQTPAGLLTTTIWYTPDVYPYILRVEKVVLSAPSGTNPGGQIVRQSVMRVTETSAFKPLRGNRNKPYRLQIEEKVGNIRKVTDARCSWSVPGGLLESTTREYDAQNREIRSSISKMTNFFSISRVD